VLPLLLSHGGWSPWDPQVAVRLARAAGPGLSASLFQEMMRWIIYRYWVIHHHNKQQQQQRSTTYETAVLLGAGHGGCETALAGVAGLKMLWLLLRLSMRDDSNTPSDGEEGRFLSPWNVVLIAPLARAIAMPMHVALSILVWRGFEHQRGAGTTNWKWLASAVFYHSFIDTVSVMVMLTWGISVNVAVLAVTVVPSAMYIIRRFAHTDEIGFQPVRGEDDAEDVEMRRV